MDVARKGPLVALFVLMSASCGPSCGRHAPAYSKFTYSHDAIRAGMSLREVFEAGLADYMMTGQGANIPGTTTSQGQPASSECPIQGLDVHYGGGNFMHAGGFSIDVLCGTNRTPLKAIGPPFLVATKRGFLGALDAQSSWVRSLEFRVQSPALQIGGVHDFYTFSVDEHGKVTTVSAMYFANP